MKRVLWLLLVLALAAGLLFLVGARRVATADAPEVWVCMTGDCGHPGAQYDSIQAGISAVAPGGVVHVAAGTYAESVLIAKPCQVIGAGPGISSITGEPGNIISATVTINSANVALAGFGLTRVGVGNSTAIACSTDNVAVAGNIISGYPVAISVGSGSGLAVIQGNTVLNNVDGLALGASSGNVVAYGNIFGGNGGVGHAAVKVGPGFASFAEIHDNTFQGNAGALDNQAAVPVHATNNWWGHPSGPTHAGNPGGTGDVVSGNVDYDPWLYALLRSGSIVWQPVHNGMLDARPQANVAVVVTGTTGIYVAAYAMEPADPPPHALDGSCVDVYLDGIAYATEAEIRYYYPKGAAWTALRLHWWDDGGWALCSLQGVVPKDEGSYGGYVWARVDDATSPALVEVDGTPFVVAYDLPHQVWLPLISKRP